MRRHAPGHTERIGVHHHRTGGTSAPSALPSRLVEYTKVVAAPDGQRYFIVVAPPGSALGDEVMSEGGGGNGLVAIAMGAARFLSNIVRGRWTVTVQPVDERGRAHGPSHREIVANQTTAEQRSEAIVAQVNSGTWQG
jgi:hypothetical protein